MLILLTGIAAYVMLVGLIARHGSRWYAQARRDGHNAIGALFHAGVFFTISYFLLFVLEPIFILAFDSPTGYYVSLLTMEDRLLLVCKASMLGLVGFLAFVYGFNSRLADKVGFLVPYFKINKTGRNRRIAVVSLFIVVGIFFFIQFDFMSILKDPSRRVELTSGKGYQFFFVQFYLTGVLLWYAYHLDRVKTSYVTSILLWALPLGIGAFGGRADVVQIWLAMVIIRSMKFKYANFFLYVSVFAMMVLFLGGFMVYRHFYIYDSLRDVDALFQKFAWSLQHLLVTYDNFLAYLDVFERSFSYAFGSNLLEFMYYVVPSDLIGEKPIRPPAMLRSVIYPDARGGTPFTLVGYFHLTFALPGILIGMYLFGLFLKIINSYLKYHRDENSVIIFYGFTVARLFILLWGVVIPGLLGYAQFYIQFIVMFLLLSKFRISILQYGRSSNNSSAVSENC